MFVILGQISVCLSQEKTIKSSVKCPAGYSRIEFQQGSFCDFIQNIPVKKNNTILSHKGTNIENDIYNIYCVADIPLLFKSDIEQCADYCMRIWAEYHKTKNKLKDLYLFDYGGKRKYYKNENKDYKSFLQQSFAFSNSSSLKRGCESVAEKDLIPGDMFVQNETGGIGHVSMIVDVCKNKEGKKLFLMGYSFMPAQEFHVEKARDKYGVEGWFTYDGYCNYLNDYLNYGVPVLKRFGK